jgi:DNA-binding MarR family transcriptional regulator
MEEGMSTFNRTIHEPTRLRIMAALMSLGPNERMQFVALRDMLELTDGNLGAHLLKLESEKLVTVDKEFVSRKPCTFVSATLRGRAAFAEHVEALKELLAAAPEPDAADLRTSTT